jgi:hypothetical protein
MAWIADWTNRKSITISRVSGAVTNYQVKLLIGESSGATGEDVDCGGLCLSSFDDLRFTTSDGTTLLDYWIESISGTTPNQLATVWVEFDSVGTTDTTFYMYYGNSGASAASNGANTFIFFDDFERGDDEDAIGGDWTDTGTNKIDTAQKWNGTRSGRCYNTSGIWKGITVSEDIAISMRAYKGDAEGVTYRFEWSTTQRAVIKWEPTDEGIYYIPGAGTWTTLSSTADHSNWHKFEFSNFNNSAATYDLWLDDAKIGNDLAMQTTTGLTAGQIWLYGRTASEYSWYDTVYVRNFKDTAPAISAWGETEVTVDLTPDIPLGSIEYTANAPAMLSGKVIPLTTFEISTLTPDSTVRVNIPLRTLSFFPLSPLSFGQTIDRNRFGVNLSGKHITLKFQNGNSNEGFYLQDLLTFMSVYDRNIGTKINVKSGHIALKFRLSSGEDGTLDYLTVPEIGFFEGR